MNDDWIDAKGRTFRDLIDRKIIKPGVLIHLEGGGQYLVGHINENGGGCDDCPEVRYTDRVVRYRRVWTEE